MRIVRIILVMVARLLMRIVRIILVMLAWVLDAYCSYNISYGCQGS